MRSVGNMEAMVAIRELCIQKLQKRPTAGWEVLARRTRLRLPRMRDYMVQKHQCTQAGGDWCIDPPS